MDVTREQIKNGVVKYLENEVVKTIKDKPVMMLTAIATNMMKSNDKAIDKLLDNPILSALLSGENGNYNLDALYDSIMQTMDTYGNLELKLPLIKAPFIFNKTDVENLRNYIEGGTDNE